MANKSPQLLRLKEAANILRLHPRYVLTLIHTKQLPAMKIGGSVGWLVRKSDIEAFVEKRIERSKSR